MKRTLLTLMFVGTLPCSAQAQVFARPAGDDQDPPSDGAQTFDPEPAPVPEPSTVRVSVGPVLRISEPATDGGLATAVDIGSGAAGARLSGAWVKVGGDGGLAEYRGELWVDFGVNKRIRPILGAGAGVARLDREDASGALETSTVGVGVLRGTLEVVLPVEQADARAGFDAIGSVPAIHGHAAGDPGAWLLLVARVGVGF